MKLFRFDAEVGRQLTAFRSHDVILSSILRTTDVVLIGGFHVQPGGMIALHQAIGPSYFWLFKWNDGYRGLRI